MNVRLQILHHFLELREVERLRAVTNGFFWRGMYFHDQSVGANCYARARQGRHEAPLSRRVARIENDGQVCQFIQRGDRGDVSAVSRHGFKRANPPLAQNHIGISVCRDVFRRH